MAKIKFGAIVTDMRGKVGSQVFSKNRSGAYARSFKVNVLSATPAQVTTRNRLAGFSAAWRGLTQGQRDSWNGNVEAFKHTNVFGSIINPSGFDLYVKLNCNLDQVGVAALSTAPLPGVSANVGSVGIVADNVAPNFLVSFDASPVPAGHFLVLSATACISPGINYVKNRLRQIVILPVATASPYNGYADYIAKFLNLIASQRVSVSIVAVNNVTGQKTKPLYATTIVAGSSGLDFDQALDTGIPLA